MLSKYLLEKLGSRTLLLVVENLDEVMQTLKSEGQKRWRAFLQEHPVVVTLARLRSGSRRVSPTGTGRSSTSFRSNTSNRFPPTRPSNFCGSWP